MTFCAEMPPNGLYGGGSQSGSFSLSHSNVSMSSNSRPPAPDRRNERARDLLGGLAAFCAAEHRLRLQFEQVCNFTIQLRDVFSCPIVDLGAIEDDPEQTLDENATVYWDTAAGCLGLVSSARACRSTSSGTKSRIGLCSNLARALSTAAEIRSGARCPYLLVRRRSTSAIISSSLISATGTACVSEHQPSTRGQLCVTRRRLMLAARGTACGGRMPKWPRMLGWRRRGCSWGCCATRSPRYPTSSKRQTAMSIDEQSTATIGG